MTRKQRKAIDVVLQYLADEWDDYERDPRPNHIAEHLEVLRDSVPRDDEFGLCPICQQTGLRFNIGPHSYLTCSEHRVKWQAGPAVKDAESGEGITKFIGAYQEVEPFRYENQNE